MKEEASMGEDPILKVENLNLTFTQYTKGLKRRELQVLNEMNLTVCEGEVLAVVGASGSGKSLLAHAILGILPYNAVEEGNIFYKGNLLTQREKERLRGREIALVPQSVTFLDPLLKVGKQIEISLSVGNRYKRDDRFEAGANSNPNIASKEVESDEEKVKNLLVKYGLDPSVADYYPHQLSGGMARKVLLCTALATDCKLIIADEPTPGLDETSLAEALGDFRRLADMGKAVLLITHDLESALTIADRVAIFYEGTTLEVAPISAFEAESLSDLHPYTRALIEALPGRGFKAPSVEEKYYDIES